MLCYKDSTFCPFWKLCKYGKGCMRALTPQVERAAKQCNLLICRFTKKPDCFSNNLQIYKKLDCFSKDKK